MGGQSLLPLFEGAAAVMPANQFTIDRISIWIEILEKINAGFVVFYLHGPDNFFQLFNCPFADVDFPSCCYLDLIIFHGYAITEIYNNRDIQE